MKINLFTKQILILLFLIIIIGCKEEVKEPYKTDKAIVVQKDIPNEITLMVNDTINSKLLNLYTHEFQSKPDLVGIGRKHNKSNITLSVEKDLVLAGGSIFKGQFSYRVRFQKGDSVKIIYNHLNINNERNIIYPSFKIINREYNYSELNFDYLLYKKNIETKALTPSILFESFESVKLDLDDNEVNMRFLLDSLYKLNKITKQFKKIKEIGIPFKKMQAKINNFFNFNEPINLEEIGVTETLLSMKDLYLNDDYLSFLSTVIRYKYFKNKKRHPNPSEYYDYIIANETFLKGKLKVSLLKKYVKAINSSNKSRFNEYLKKFEKVAVEKDHIEFLKRANKYQENQDYATDSPTGSLNDLTRKNHYDFKDIIEKEKGKVILVDFWASWCIPCRKETPYIKNLEKSIDSTQFTLISISIDDDIQSWERASKVDAIDKNKHNYIITNWKQSSLYIDYKIMTIPRYLLFNKNGKIIDDNAPRPSDKYLEVMINNYITEL